ncbi:MAG: Sec-independent protein translocase subunit TatA [Streptosporangiales bacterium]|nr:Sec-independent protein translocase subunit TatA [Streptosporangiales bacterium]MBO0891488.1 Sec-independent protein translocase subunit TatA [Acidothermales bacterium]
MGALSPWHILIVVLILVVLFGSTKLPTLARSLGRSARILKSEAKSLHEDEDDDEGTDGEKRQVNEAPKRSTATASEKERQSAE